MSVMKTLAIRRAFQVVRSCRQFGCRHRQRQSERVREDALCASEAVWEVETGAGLVGASSLFLKEPRSGLRKCWGKFLPSKPSINRL